MDKDTISTVLDYSHEYFSVKDVIGFSGTDTVFFSDGDGVKAVCLKIESGTVSGHTVSDAEKLADIPSQTHEDGPRTGDSAEMGVYYLKSASAAPRPLIVDYVTTSTAPDGVVWYERFEGATKADPAQLSVNEFVWIEGGEEGEEPAYGKILRKSINATLRGFPGGETVRGKPDAPAFLVQIFIKNGGKWKPTRETRAARGRALTKAGESDKEKAVAENSLKALDIVGDYLVVGNHIVLWGSPEKKDLSGIGSPARNDDGTIGEYFVPDTNFESAYTRSVGRLPIDVEHGMSSLDGLGRNTVLGYVEWKSARKTPDGLWVERWLDMRNEYVKQIEHLIRLGLIATSSEAVPEGVEKAEDGMLKSWPLVRDSMTVRPMEWRMYYDSNTLQLVKSALEGLDETMVKALGGEAAVKAALDSLLPEAAAEGTVEPVVEEEAAAEEQDTEQAYSEVEQEGAGEVDSDVEESVTISDVSEAEEIEAPVEEEDVENTEAEREYLVASADAIILSL